MKSNSNRKSGLELLRLISIALIVLCHSIPQYGSGDYYINIGVAQDGWQYTFLYVLWAFGNIGVASFVIISSYFLLESTQVRAIRFWSVVADTLFVSIVWMVMLLLCGVDVSVHEVFNTIIPIASENDWFIGVYLILYLLHPMLNSAISGLNQRKHLFIICIFVFYYSVIAVIRPHVYYNSRLMSFIMIYFITAYLKKYCSKLRSNAKKNTVVFLCMTVLVVSVDLILQYKIKTISMMLFTDFYTPFVLIMAFAAFNVFNNMNIKSAIINEFASVTLIIYVLHENILYRNKIKPQIFEYLYNEYTYCHLVLMMLIIATITFSVSMVIALVYKHTFRKIVLFVVDKWSVLFMKVTDKLLEILERTCC